MKGVWRRGLGRHVFGAGAVVAVNGGVFFEEREGEVRCKVE